MLAVISLVAAVRLRGEWASVAGAAGFVVVTAAVARAVHGLVGVPYTEAALFASPTFQAALAVTWTLGALGLSVVAQRRQSRSLWFYGAGVLALVVVKLFVVDLATTPALVRIGSFIAVGVLVLLIGYRSPLPPKRAEP